MIDMYEEMEKRFPRKKQKEELKEEEYDAETEEEDDYAIRAAWQI